MTIEEIRQMPAGAQIDWLIATEIFNGRKPTLEQIEMVKVISFQFGHYGGEDDNFAETALIAPLPHRNRYTGAEFCFVQPRQYSTDIAAAWRVVEKMHADGWFYDVGDEVETPEHYARFHRQSGAGFALADTAPLAICRAALIAKLEAK
jgi:hypothetical protein